MPRPNPLLPLSVNAPEPVTAFQNSRLREAQIGAFDARAGESESRGRVFEDQSNLKIQQAAEQTRKLAEFESVLRGVKKFGPMVPSSVEEVPRFIQGLQERSNEIRSTGGDSSDTDGIIKMAQAGDFEGIKKQFSDVLEIGRQLQAKGVGVNISERNGTDIPSPIADRRDLIGGFSEEDQKLARRIEAGLDVRAGTTSATERIAVDDDLTNQVADSSATIAGAVEGSKQAAQIAAIPEKVQAQFQAEFKSDAPKRIQSANASIARIDGVMAEANLAIDDIGTTTTGILGQINRKIAGTTAFALARKIDTIQANLSFDRIAEMRKNSPTGGALGQVSERELSLLGAAVVSLDQANNEAEVRRAFEKVVLHYSNWKAVITGQKNADALIEEGAISEVSEPEVIDFSQLPP